MPRGQPKKFKTGDELIELWREFCTQIVENGYEIAPTQTEFCKWLKLEYDGADIKTVYNSLNKYFPSKKKEFEQIRGDVIAQGAMLGKYHATMTIFALKNWCNWTDKPQEEVDDLDKLNKIIEGLNRVAQS
jgi:hypothetical protein